MLFFFAFSLYMSSLCSVAALFFLHFLFCSTVPSVHHHTIALLFLIRSSSQSQSSSAILILFSIDCFVPLAWIPAERPNQTSLADISRKRNQVVVTIGRVLNLGPPLHQSNTNTHILIGSVTSEECCCCWCLRPSRNFAKIDLCRVIYPTLGVQLSLISRFSNWNINISHDNHTNASSQVAMWK